MSPFRSLGLTIDLAVDESLAGIGMWALGYDGARPEFWAVLDERLGGCCAGDIDGDGTTNVVDLLALLAAWGPCRSA